MKHCDFGTLEKMGFIPVVTLKSKSGNDGSHGKSEARSFAKETNQ